MGSDRVVHPEAEPGVRPRKATTRKLVNAILYFWLKRGLALAAP